VALAVRRRIEAGPAPRRSVRRPALVVALAALVAVTAAALAVPQARTAILRALGIGAVRVDLVEGLPALAPRTDLSLLGPPVAREEAERRFAHPLLDADGADEVRVAYDDSSVTYVWLDEDGIGIRLLISQLTGRMAGRGYVKIAEPSTAVEDLVVEGRPAMWIGGTDAHGFGLVREGDMTYEMLRISENALLVQDGEVTLRIEGDFDRDEAIEIAERVL
jgi:hypothetical protein